MTMAMRNRRRIGILWMVFALIFAALAVHHLIESRNHIPHIQMTERPGAAGGSVRILGMDADKPLRDFVQHFNAFVDNQNETWRNLNLAAFAGFVVAALTALFSALMEFLPRDISTHPETDRSAPDPEK